MEAAAANETRNVLQPGHPHEPASTPATISTAGVRTPSPRALTPLLSLSRNEGNDTGSDSLWATTDHLGIANTRVVMTAAEWLPRDGHPQRMLYAAAADEKRHSWKKVFQQNIFS